MNVRAARTEAIRRWVWGHRHYSLVILRGLGRAPPCEAARAFHAPVRRRLLTAGCHFFHAFFELLDVLWRKLGAVKLEGELVELGC